MGVRIKYTGCKCCGNRYPEGEGYGWFGEFCSDGCKIKYNNMVPGYLHAAKKKYKRQNLFKWLFRIVIVVIIILIVKGMI